MEKGAQSRGKQYVVLLANTKTQEFLKRIFRRTSKETFLVPYQEKYMHSFLYIILCFFTFIQSYQKQSHFSRPNISSIITFHVWGTQSRVVPLKYILVKLFIVYNTLLIICAQFLQLNRNIYWRH